jgi:hypothetical protein
MSTTYPAVVGDHMGNYEAIVLTAADADELAGAYVADDDMYFRGGTRNDWIELTGAVLIRPLNDHACGSDVLLASEFNARFGTAVPVPVR